MKQCNQQACVNDREIRTEIDEWASQHHAEDTWLQGVAHHQANQLVSSWKEEIYAPLLTLPNHSLQTLPSSLSPHAALPRLSASSPHVHQCLHCQAKPVVLAAGLPEHMERCLARLLALGHSKTATGLTKAPLWRVANYIEELLLWANEELARWMPRLREH